MSEQALNLLGFGGAELLAPADAAATPALPPAAGDALSEQPASEFSLLLAQLNGNPAVSPEGEGVGLAVPLTPLGELAMPDTSDSLTPDPAAPAGATLDPEAGNPLVALATPGNRTASDAATPRFPHPTDPALDQQHGRGTPGPRTGHFYLPQPAAPLPTGEALQALDPSSGGAEDEPTPVLQVLPAGSGSTAEATQRGVLPTLTMREPGPAAPIAIAPPATADATGPEQLAVLAEGKRPPAARAVVTEPAPIQTEPPGRATPQWTSTAALSLLNQSQATLMRGRTALPAAAAESVTDVLELNTPSPSSGASAPTPATPAAGVTLNGPPPAPLLGSALGQVTDQVRVMLQTEQREAKIQLHPRELGVVNIRLSLHADQASIVVEASNPDLQRELSQHVPRLREIFSQEGLNLSQFSLDQHTPGQREGGPEHRSFGENDLAPLADLPDATALPAPLRREPSRLLDVFA